MPEHSALMLRLLFFNLSWWKRIHCCRRWHYCSFAQDAACIARLFRKKRKRRQNGKQSLIIDICRNDWELTWQARTNSIWLYIRKRQGGWERLIDMEGPLSRDVIVRGWSCKFINRYISWIWKEIQLWWKRKIAGKSDAINWIQATWCFLPHPAIAKE